MKRMENNYIAREAIKVYKLKYYEIAEALGLSPQALSQRLRREIPFSEQMEIVDIAESIAKAKGTYSCDSKKRLQLVRI